MRVLVDTNVFLDAILNRGPFFEDSNAFFEYFSNNGHWLYISSMSFRDIEYVLRKVEKDPFERRKTLSHIYAFVHKIIDLGADDVIDNLFDDHKDFEDGLLIESAKRNMLDAIITNNVKDFIDGDIPVFTPKDVVSHLKNAR